MLPFHVDLLQKQLQPLETWGLVVRTLSFPPTPGPQFCRFSHSCTQTGPHLPASLASSCRLSGDFLVAMLSFRDIQLPLIRCQLLK